MSVQAPMGMVGLGCPSVAPERGEGWRDRAACAVEGSSPEMWFPEEPGDEVFARAAQRVCRLCPVADECLRYAIATKQRDGIWGGLLPDQVRRLQRLQARAVRGERAGVAA